MPTLDYVKDLIELFQENQKEYLIVVVQPTKKKKKVYTFYKIDSKDSAEIVGNSLHYIAQQILGQPPQGSTNVVIEKPKKKDK